MLQQVRTARSRYDSVSGNGLSSIASGGGGDSAANSGERIGEFFNIRGPARSRGVEEIIRRRDKANTMVKQEIIMHKVRSQMSKDGGWVRSVFGIGPKFAGLPGSKLIHPHSPFAVFVSTTSAMLLMYSALVSTFMIGFLWNADPCEQLPTLNFDTFVDSFFLSEILFTFFVGVVYQGEYRDNLRFVAERYIKGGLIFDMVTSVPVSFIERATINACTDGQASTQGLRVVRALKPLKIARILRTLKFMRIIGFFSFAGDYLRIPPFVVRLLKILSFILVLVHANACMYWLVKENSNSTAQLRIFLERQGLPGLQTAIWERYVISLYYVNTIFCTIGFGDIHGENTAERLFTVFTFYVGVLVFGTLLAEVQDAVNKARADARERSNKVNTVIEFLRENDIPLGLERRIVHWLEFGFTCMQSQDVKNEVLSIVPENLHRQLALHLHSNLLYNVEMFRNLEDVFREDFVLDVWAEMRPAIFSPFVPLANSDEEADRMFVITSGTVILQQDGEVISTLHPGDYFGEFALLGETQWGYGRCTGHATFLAITNVMCLFLTKKCFDNVLSAYPGEIPSQLHAVRQDQLDKALLIGRSESYNGSNRNLLTGEPGELPHWGSSKGGISPNSVFSRRRPSTGYVVSRWSELTMHMLKVHHQKSGRDAGKMLQNAIYKASGYSDGLPNIASTGSHPVLPRGGSDRGPLVGRDYNARRTQSSGEPSQAEHDAVQGARKPSDVSVTFSEEEKRVEIPDAHGASHPKRGRRKSDYVVEEALEVFASKLNTPDASSVSKFDIDNPFRLAGERLAAHRDSIDRHDLIPMSLSATLPQGTSACLRSESGSDKMDLEDDPVDNNGHVDGDAMELVDHDHVDHRFAQPARNSAGHSKKRNNSGSNRRKHQRSWQWREHGFTMCSDSEDSGEPEYGPGVQTDCHQVSESGKNTMQPLLATVHQQAEILKKQSEEISAMKASISMMETKMNVLADNAAKTAVGMADISSSIQKFIEAFGQK